MYKKLIKIEKLLSDKFFCYFKSDDILAISEDKATLPFMFIISDAGYKSNLLVSIAVDYPNSINVAEVCLAASTVSDCLLGEPYFISVAQEGKTFFGDEAFEAWDMSTIDLSDLEPENNLLN